MSFARIFSIAVLMLLQAAAPYLHAHERAAAQTGFHLHLVHAARVSESVERTCLAAACAAASVQTDGESPDIGMPVELTRIAKLAPSDCRATQGKVKPPARAPPLGLSKTGLVAGYPVESDVGRPPERQAPLRSVSPLLLYYRTLAPPTTNPV